MFAVPGWSVSSSNLKTQTAQPVKATTNSTAPPKNEGTEEAARPSKKRKRSGSKSKAVDVNPANLADLWETVIEGKPKEKKDPKSAQEKSKSKSKEHGEKQLATPKEDGASGDADTAQGAEGEDEPKKVFKKAKTLKEKKREKKAALKQLKDSSTDGSSTNTKTTNPPPDNDAKPPPLPTPTAKLTPLQASMRQKLISARFRHLNQTLYTTPSAHSLELFQQNPEMFQEYHEGFRRQVEVWPENPVDGYIQQIRTRGKQRGPNRGAGAPDGKDSAVSPLPRTEGTCRIADLGCGDAALAQGLQKDSKALKLRIHSFDLQNPSPLVTRADIANLPLEDASIDVAIFCLALMGTNWIDFIEEAFRVLRWKGELWVAEIKSRFGRVGGGKQKRVEHSVGNRTKNDKKALKKQEEEFDEKDLEVEVDGQEDSKQETDVSAFVEVLRKRGFVLQGDPDLRNKMFVKMRFVKGLTPTKGKGVPALKSTADTGTETWKKKPKGKFIDEEVPVADEASVLKPCVYKLR
jgi:ribosomal RNA-processing protein 8